MKYAKNLDFHWVFPKTPFLFSTDCGKRCGKFFNFSTDFLRQKI
jgi:hypothetical protein